jgi:hypothetical protein
LALDVAMKKIFLFLLTASLLLAFSKHWKVNPFAKQKPAAHIPEPVAQALPAIQALLEEQERQKAELKTATPDADLGPIVTVVGPLAEWAGKQHPASPKSASAEPEPFVLRKPQKIDHIALSYPAKSRNFLHSVFPVSTSAQFAFEVPPHTWNPRLNGTFRSYTERSAPDSSSDRTADIDVMLLNEKEYDDFRHGRQGNATYDLYAAHNQSVGWRVPSTLENAQQYHLVFSNLPGGAKTKFVKADFTISFQ